LSAWIAPQSVFLGRDSNEELAAKSFETFIPAVILLLVVSLLKFANAAGPVPILSPGDHTITLSHGARERSAVKIKNKWNPMYFNRGAGIPREEPFAE
jgi:hypothetical protein